MVILSVGMLGLLQSMASANPPPDGAVTISPYDPSATWQAEHELQSGESVKFTVTVEDSGNPASGGAYQIEGDPEITYTEPNTLWTQTTDESPYEFNALNTGVTVIQDTVKLAVVWKKDGPKLGGGGGVQADPDTLDGSAYGTVYSETAVFTWTCNPKLQFADGESVIDFTVSGSVNGAAVDLAGYTIAGEPAWTIAQNQNGNDIQGTVKSTTPSEGNLKIENAGNLQDTNPEKIGFAKLDLAIAAFGDGDDMEEDRQPGGGAAPAPHEMNPGGVVLAAFEESEATFPRTKLTLTGSGQNPGTNGTYTLSQQDLTKAKIYDADEDGNLITLPKIWQSAEFGAGKTLYIESEPFAEEDEPEEGSLKLKYKCEFEGNNEELSDEVTVSPIPVRIGFDVGMIGVVGDTVPSVDTTSTISHFVTPKKTTQIPADDVVLKLIGIDPKYITPGQAEQIFEWDATVGQSIDGEPLKRKVSRLTPGRHSVKVKSKNSGDTILETIVWVVWCDITTTPGTANFQTFTNTNPAGSQYKNLDQIGNKWRFVFKINPSSILDQNTLNRPNLSTAPTKPVPGIVNLHAIDPTNGPGDSATAKWDVSRQVKVTIRNPDSISKEILAAGGQAAAWNVNQPAAVDTPVPFPGMDTEGNDDPAAFGDEDVNPYAAKQGNDLDHAFGELSSNDAPNLRVLADFHPPGNSYSIELNLHEFARLEIWDQSRTSGKFWFRISDLEKWHHYLDASYDESDGKWIDAGSSHGVGHPKP